MESFLFYDLETTGLCPDYDQVLQFAAIRTDQELNELSRHQFYVRLSPDRVPNLSAVKTHKITYEMSQSGQSEYEAIRYIHSLMNQPGTCSIGYNSLAFDDNFLRFSFHRNLLNPYTHQYANGCRRADVLLMLLPFFNFANDALAWPDPLSLKLEHMVLAQGLSMGAAHDAMNDVIATLDIARLMYKRSKQWQYVLELFDKSHEQGLKFTDVAIWLHTSLGYSNDFMAPVVVLLEHKLYKHRLLWRLDDPAWSEVRINHDYSLLGLQRKKAGEQGFLWSSDVRYKQFLSVQQQELMQQNYEFIIANTAEIKEYVKPLTQVLYSEIPNLDVDAAIYQLGFKDQVLENTCKLFTLADMPEKVFMLSRFPEPYLEQARRIIWRHDSNLLNGNDALAMQQYQIKFDQMRLDHKGKEFARYSEILRDLLASDSPEAASWAKKFE